MAQTYFSSPRQRFSTIEEHVAWVDGTVRLNGANLYVKPWLYDLMGRPPYLFTDDYFTETAMVANAKVQLDNGQWVEIQALPQFEIQARLSGC